LIQNHYMLKSLTILLDPIGDRNNGESDSGPGWSLGVIVSLPIAVIYLSI